MFKVVSREKTNLSQFPPRVGEVLVYSDGEDTHTVYSEEGGLPECISRKSMDLCLGIAEIVSIPTPWVGYAGYKATTGPYFSPAVIAMLHQLELASTPEGLPEGAVHIGVNLWELEGEYITRTEKYWVKINKLRVAKLLSTEQIFLEELSEKEYELL